MILARFTVVCDGCGLVGPSSTGSPTSAVSSAQADGWAYDGLARNPTHNWCPPCTKARKES